MELYYSKGACSLAPRIVINQLGLKSKYTAVDLKTKKTENGDDFLQINPKGSVPVLVTDNGDILTENAVILQYLANQKDKSLLYSENDMKHYRLLEWINFVATDMHKGVGILFNPVLSQEDKDKIFIPIIKSKLKFLNKHLQTHKYLMGNEFSLPDAYLFVILNWIISIFKINLSEYSNVTRYFGDLQKIKSVQAALQEEGLHPAMA